MVYRVIIFFILNFGALYIGAFFTGKGVPSDWYISLNKAPWDPPGWVFGSAWTIIMICFSIFMAYSWSLINNKKLLISLFVIQWVLNVSWNPTFFYYHNVLIGLIIITSLTLVISAFIFTYWSELKFKVVLILPYLIWLCIATSLNGYILLKN